MSHKHLIFKGTYTKKGVYSHPTTPRSEKLVFKKQGESSLQDVFCKQTVLQNPAKLVGKNLGWGLFLIKMQVWGLLTY